MQNSSATPARAIRVMIVDDHKAILWGLERLINSASPRMNTVATASSRTEMLAAVAASRPDVLVLDLDLHGDSALDAIPDLLRLGAGQILVLTGARDPALHQSAFLKGARGVVAKDESAETLLQAIERVYQGEVWINRKMMARVLNSVAGIGQMTQDGESARIASLTAREHDIVRAVVHNRGAKTRVIAESLNISEHTLRNHLTVVYDKLGARNRLDLFAYAIEHGLGAE